MWYTRYGPETMQGWKGCDQLSINQTITLTDARDNNQYTIAKAADGKCWMANNLRIMGPKTLTPNDSDIVQQFSLPSSNCLSTNFPYGAGSNIARICSDSSSSTYGNFYNWYTMTAGSGTVEMSSGYAPYSICPKNWRLPTSFDIQEFMKYYTSAYGAINSPAKFLLSGYCSNYSNNGNYPSGCPGARGFFTCYPTATLMNANFYVGLHIYYGNGYNEYQLNNSCSGYNSKAVGSPVKCIFDKQ